MSNVINLPPNKLSPEVQDLTRDLSIKLHFFIEELDRYEKVKDIKILKAILIDQFGKYLSMLPEDYNE